MIQGHVYNKMNGSPICGMCVSDGRHVVRTDAGGKYTLPGWERAHVVNVQTLTGEHDDWYRRIEDGVSDYDFTISPVDAEKEHTFLHISDTEIGRNGCGDWLNFVKKCVAEEHPAFLIHTGDICRKPGLETHYREMNARTMGCPVRYTLGNHDYVDECYGEYTFERLYGPVWYSYDVGDVHYVVLPIKGGEAPGIYENADCDIWLRNDLSFVDSEKKLVFFCHDLCSPDEENFILHIEGKPFDLKEHNLLAWIFGHYHHHFLNDLGGRYNICTARPDCGGIDSSPAAVRKVQIHRDGTLTSSLLYNDLSALPAGDPPVWRTKLEGHVQFCEPLCAEGDLFVGTVDDGYPKQCGIYRLDGKTGRMKWHIATENSVKNRLVYGDKQIFAQDCSGNVYCICAEDGSLVWKKRILLQYARHTENGILLSDGVLYAGSGKQVFALDAKTGSEIWRSEKCGGDEGPARYVLQGDILLVSAQWHGIYALDRKNGSLLWKNYGPWYRTSTPVIDGNTVILGSDQTLYRLDLSSGETILKTTPEPALNFNTASAPVLHGENIYLSTAANGVVRFQAETFEKTWEYPCGGSILPASPYVGRSAHEVEGTPVIFGDTLIFSAADGYLYFYNTKTGEESCRIEIGAPSYVSPVILDDTVVVADFCGRATAYSLE